MSLPAYPVQTLEKTKIFPVDSPQFTPYGRILQVQGLPTILEVSVEHLEIPLEGVAYQPSLEFLEGLSGIQELGQRVFGGVPVQAGWCIGKNRRLNALEYHKTSEVILALTDLVLMLGSFADIQHGMYPSDAIEGFLLPQGTAVEILSEVLHFAPQHLNSQGFGAIIMLPQGTNSPLDPTLMSQVQAHQTDPCQDQELARLWMVNKWMICHKDSLQAGRGARIGITGRNLELPKDLVDLVNFLDQQVNTI